MPIRAFVTQDLKQLAVTIGLLEQALHTGQLNELRAAGVMTRTGKIDVQLAYNQARYEAYLRAQDAMRADPGYVPGANPQTGLSQETLALFYKWRNPYRENVRRVEAITTPTGLWYQNPYFLP